MFHHRHPNNYGYTGYNQYNPGYGSYATNLNMQSLPGGQYALNPNASYTLNLNQGKSILHYKY